MTNFMRKFLFILLVFSLIGCKAEDIDVQEETKSLVIATVVPEFEEYIHDVYAKYYGSEVTTKTIFSSAKEVSEHWTDLDVVIDKFLQDNQDVDLIYGISPEYISGLVKTGSIKNLNNVLDESITSNIAPVFKEPMIQIGSGNMYAVAPTFINHVLVYNKEILNEVGVQEPKSGMTWEEISELSSQILAKSNYKGFSLAFSPDDEQYYFNFQQMIISVGNYENNHGKVILNTVRNQKYWSLFANLYNDNSRVTGEEFVKGEVAMGVFELDLFLDDKFLEYYGNLNKSQWGILAMPITEENPGSIMFSESIFVMSKYSNNKEAVRFLEYLHGKEFARVLLNNSLLPTYWDDDIKQQLEEKYGYDLTPVYIQPGIVYDKPKFNSLQYNKIKNTGAKYFLKYLNSNEDINDILTAYENEVN